jgi:hypothetical protein
MANEILNQRGQSDSIGQELTVIGIRNSWRIIDQHSAKHLERTLIEKVYVYLSRTPQAYSHKRRVVICPEVAMQQTSGATESIWMQGFSRPRESPLSGVVNDDK